MVSTRISVSLIFQCLCTAMKTPYQILGLDSRASNVDVENRYHALLTSHIARHGARPLQQRLRNRHRQRMQAVREAYLLLSSPSSRLAYDMDLRIRELEAARRRRRAAGMAGIASLVLGIALLVGGVFHAMHSDTVPNVPLSSAGNFLIGISASRN
jgi:DnaJ-class molecular chaperone